MKFIVKTESFRGGDYQYSDIEVINSDINEIYEKHLFWHDNKVCEEKDEDFLKFLIKVYSDINLEKFGFTDDENYKGPIIKNYSETIIEDDITYDVISYIIPSLSATFFSF